VIALVDRAGGEIAETIIAKGQGNFETLAGAPGNIFFLLKIKCSVVAAHTGLEIGTQALIRYPCEGGTRRLA
jgi:damage-control phosphatase, subfamily I